MKCKELSTELGTTAMRIGKVRKELFPESSGDISSKEADAIRRFLQPQAPKHLLEVKVVHADPRFHGFADAKIKDTGEVILIQIPYGYEAERFVGREVFVERTVTDEGVSIYQYNPWIDVMDKQQIKAHQDAALRHLHAQMQEGEEIPPHEICRRTGLSRDAVDMAYRRGLAKLQKAFRRNDV